MYSSVESVIALAAAGTVPMPHVPLEDEVEIVEKHFYVICIKPVFGQLFNFATFQLFSFLRVRSGF